MRFIYKRSTFLICMMTAFIALLFLYLYTDLKIWKIQYEIAESFRSALLLAEQEDPSEENIRAAADRFGKQYRVKFVFFEAETSSKEIGSDKKTDEESDQGEFVALPPVKYEFKFDTLGSFMKMKRTLSSGARYEAEITYSPLGIVLRRYFGIYILIIGAFALLEFGIVKSQDLSQKNRFGKMIRSTLITGFSHELKTPLAVVRVLVENWDYIDEKDRPAYSEQMTKEVEHFEQISEKLRGIGELNSDRIFLRRRSVDLPAMVRTACEHQKMFIEDRKLDVVIHVDHPEKCMIHADPELIRIAVENFVSNAVKYSEKEIRIEISAGNKVLFRISNDGKTLTKQETKKVWDLFYKMDPSRTDRFESSGVGLAVTKSILKAHHAKFGCISKPSNTTFWFKI